MDAPYQASKDVHVLPANLMLPGVGVLPINAYALLAEEPVLVDAGLASDADAFVDALSSIVDPSAIRWVWLTHDDMDHTGALQRIFELAPHARLVTHGLSALRMATWWPVPMDRVHAIRPGDSIHAGDRTLRAVKPPLFDNPMSTGLIDESTGALFSVDAFGALLPEPVESVADVADDALAGGMAGWATTDSPWAHLLDRERFSSVLDEVRSLAPTQIFSSHLPAANGDCMERFLEVLASVPDAEPAVPPDAEQFGHLVAAIAAMQEGGAPPPAGAGA